jgi:hypothetical protein
MMTISAGAKVAPEAPSYRRDYPDRHHPFACTYRCRAWVTMQDAPIVRDEIVYCARPGHIDLLVDQWNRMAAHFKQRPFYHYSVVAVEPVASNDGLAVTRNGAAQPHRVSGAVAAAKGASAVPGGMSGAGAL